MSALTVRSKKSESLSEYALEQRREQVGTVRCMWCTWSASGRLLDCAGRAAEHRRREHPDFRARKTVKPQSRSQLTSEQREARQREREQVKREHREGERRERTEFIVALLHERGPMRAAEVAEVLGMSTASTAVFMAWAVRHGGPLERCREARDEHFATAKKKMWRIAETADVAT